MKQLIRNIVAAAIVITTPISADDHQDGARAILADLIAIKTVDGNHETTKAANYLAEKFIKAGIPSAYVTRIDHTDMISSLIVRYKGKDSGKKPILVMAHMDVVPAERSDWSMDPFTLNEKDGTLYGRGVKDNKGGVATTAATILRFARSGYMPDRDIILLYSGDEESNGYSLMHLIKDHRDLIESEYALNTDAGGGVLSKGTAISYKIQASEKTYQSFKLSVTNSGGHSSLPRPDNAIYDLVNGLQRLSRYQFPVMLNPVSAGYFKGMAKVVPSPASKAMRDLANDPTDDKAAKILSAVSPFYNAVMRTTCIATMLDGGHAENALPQTADAVINCRIAPTQSVDAVEAMIITQIANPEIKVTRMDEAFESDPSPLRPDVLDALDATILEIWGSLPIIPTMSTGATDGLYLRNAGIPVYGVAGIFSDENGSNSHGRDEHIDLESFNKALEHWDSILRRLTGGMD